MKLKQYILLFILFPSICCTQQTIDFEYFRRAGKVDVRYFIKNNKSKSQLPYQSEFLLNNTSEEQFFVLEFSNLRLGLDKNTSELKQEKDIENYMLHIPIDPSSITLSTESLQFANITNDGILSDVNTTKANKKIALYYSYYNQSANNVSSQIQIKFKVEAVEGARPLKEEHKGGDIIKCTITVKPNEQHHRQLEFAEAENKLFNDYKKATETAYKIKFAREYLSNYKTINQDRSNEITEFLSGVQQFISPINYDKKIYEQIVKFCVTEKETNRCETLCSQYQDFVWDNPNNYKGTYLENAYVHRIELLADEPNQQWLALCKKFIQKFPSSQDRYLVNTLKEEYEQTIEDQKNRSKSSFAPQHSNPYSRQVKEDKEQPNIDDRQDPAEEDEIIMPQKEDWASILIHDDNAGVTVRTGGLSSEGYVVEFRDVSDQRIKYDPSFVGEKESIELDDALEGKFKAGNYKISVFSKINRELLFTNSIEYSSTKLPPELKYILMVSCISLGFVCYKKYLKL